ncbi:hypothetical protein C8R45DRAFT_921833 [Mycena sanguinolenta]|nr:hypothetical protein C8R45DRAFT_921833 [Mycena sanguinolenta]
MRFCTERRREGRQTSEGSDEDRTNGDKKEKSKDGVRTVLVLVLADVGASRSVQSKIGSTVWRAVEVELLAQYAINVRGCEGLEDGGVRGSWLGWAYENEKQRKRRRMEFAGESQREVR